MRGKADYNMRMFPPNHRHGAWSALTAPHDILVIGGGITGAGIAREAARLGLRVALVEQRDFAWGTSSRSSKLVHGGLRYLKEGRIFLTRASVSERQRLLDEGAGLIDPLGFLLATYKGDSPGRRVYGAGLSVYDLLALQWSHRYYSAADFKQLAPFIADEGLQGGFRYGDAQTDDARLVLRVLSEAAGDGALLLNYARAETLLRDEHGVVAGAVIRDQSPETRGAVEARARVVINATGAWADILRAEVGGVERIRPLRGSHLIFPAWRLPVNQALSFLHPVDRRPVFIFPWEGVTLVGTTDVDHRDKLDAEPRISPDEVAYLMAAVESQFPALGLTLDDAISAFAGVRPVIGTGKADPSKESRDHVVWEESGLLTVTGGKLTTFRRIALDALRAASKRLPQMREPKADMPVLSPVNVPLGPADLSETERRRLLGRYGAHAPALVAAARVGELERVPGSSTLSSTTCCCGGRGSGCCSPAADATSLTAREPSAGRSLAGTTRAGAPRPRVTPSCGPRATTFRKRRSSRIGARNSKTPAHAAQSACSSAASAAASTGFAAASPRARWQAQASSPASGIGRGKGERESDGE